MKIGAFVLARLKSRAKRWRDLLKNCYFLVRLTLLRRRKFSFDKTSKKVAYVGHSYHKTTRSNQFLIDLLEQHFELEIVYDDSWKGGAFPDLSFIDESYLAVIFFQVPPPKDVAKKVRNQNVIFFPMYDGVSKDFSWWARYPSIKVVSFSRTLQGLLSRWGFHSLYVQYFPRPMPFSPGDKTQVFFWQRHEKININVVEALLGDGRFQVHIHTATDPFHSYVEPSPLQEAKFGITYSSWFESRSELAKLIEQRGVYIAPRESEGIGMSFLEAMAQGKAVIAVNNPTMNEYIRHNDTGYLYDLERVERLDLTRLEQVQAAAYQACQQGFLEWEARKAEIIDFVYRATF